MGNIGLVPERDYEKPPGPAFYFPTREVYMACQKSSKMSAIALIGIYVDGMDPETRKRAERTLDYWWEEKLTW